MSGFSGETDARIVNDLTRVEPSFLKRGGEGGGGFWFSLFHALVVLTLGEKLGLAELGSWPSSFRGLRAAPDAIGSRKH